MIQLSQKPVPDRAPRPYLAAFLVAGVLAVGGSVGLAFNHGAGSHGGVRAALAGIDAEGDDGDTVSAQEVVSTEAASSSLVPTPAALQVANVTPPDNPFAPTEAAPLPKPVSKGPQAVFPAGAVKMQGPLVRSAPAPALPKPEAPAPAPAMDDVTLTGIVHGEPEVAVLKYQGQSLFLKIGDQVADAWRLTEIKERSAIFQLGGRRIEIQIQGGSSQ